MAALARRRLSTSGSVRAMSRSMAVSLAQAKNVLRPVLAHAQTITGVIHLEVAPLVNEPGHEQGGPL